MFFDFDNSVVLRLDKNGFTRFDFSAKRLFPYRELNGWLFDYPIVNWE